MGKKTIHHINYIHEYGLNFDTNEIYLHGVDHYGTQDDPGVDYAMANKFIKNINILQAKSDDPILIHMKTGGGDVIEGMAIYDAIKTCKNHVIMLNYGDASSMSSIIFLAGDYRLMMPSSTYMFHMGSFGMFGTVKQTMSAIEDLKRSNEQMMNIYVQHLKSRGKFTKKTPDWIRKWLIQQMDTREEVYLSAEEAVEHGFADAIYDGSVHIYQFLAQWKAIADGAVDEKV